MLSRRRLLGAAAGVSAAAALRLTPFTVGTTSTARAAGTTGLTFTPIGLSSEDRVAQAPGYTSRVLIRWGDPLFRDSNAFSFERMDAASQAMSFGYNCDYVGYLPKGPDWGLLVVNHEYTNPDLMFEGYSASSPTGEQVATELAAHGLTVVAIERHRTLGWRYVIGAWHNRRITATSSIMMSGPAAGHPLLRTSEDPGGYRVAGTLNNCGAGITPWGTVLTCEENFNQYFANNDQVTDATTRAAHKRYGLPAAESERKWERFYGRFDLASEPNEAYRFGWVVEVDPEDPASLPRKRTALGRFKHEATSTVVAPDGRVVVYMGDDERFDYMYRFVSDGRYDPANREANLTLLDAGTLSVARFNDDGTGRWIPLLWGTGPLTAANGFRDQGEVLIKARLAGDAVGATKMDRPEDIEVNPVNNRVYCVMTNNSRRGTAGQPGTDAANPRKENRHGHVIELTAAAGNHAADAFSWNFLLICGNPSVDAGTFWSSADPAAVSPISSPDNITFDGRGNLWIATDGQTSTFKKNDGVFAVAVEGPERGLTKQFFSGVPGAEVASLCFDDRDETLFVTVQHPGEDTPLANPSSRFPDGAQPRPSVVFVRKNDGGVVGT
jgi:hypothetical protein